jgi:hypothetical protein
LKRGVVDRVWRGDTPLECSVGNPGVIGVKCGLAVLSLFRRAAVLLFAAVVVVVVVEQVRVTLRRVEAVFWISLFVGRLEDGKTLVRDISN